MKNLLLLLLLTTVLNLIALNLPDNIDISASENGIIPVPANLDAFWTNNFALYTKYITPNGGAIHIIAQANISKTQVLQVRNVLSHYLTDYPGAAYRSNFKLLKKP